MNPQELAKQRRVFKSRLYIHLFVYSSSCNTLFWHIFSPFSLYLSSVLLGVPEAGGDAKKIDRQRTWWVWLWHENSFHKYSPHYKVNEVPAAIKVLQKGEANLTEMRKHLNQKGNINF